MMNIFPDLPTILSQAERMDSVSTPLADYKSLFNQLANGHIFSTIIPQNGFWYRVRKNSGTTLYENTRELWYPPSEKITLLGRANEPRNPVLYLSEDGAVALRETNFADGDLHTLIECEVAPSYSLLLQEIGILENNLKPSFVALSGVIQNQISSAHVRGYGNMRDQPTVREYFVREFTRHVEAGNEHSYKASAALSSILFSRQDCDGIAYPAMRSDKLDVNLALKPSSADEKIRIRRVIVIQGIKTPQGEIAVRQHFTSGNIEPSGSIHYVKAVEQTTSLPWISTCRFEPNGQKTST